MLNRATQRREMMVSMLRNATVRDQVKKEMKEDIYAELPDEVK
jgi:hypothetical protein